MSKTVSLTIDGKVVSVAEGTSIVDAAKKIGINIPVFCHHPKMEPVGMCRMCLVEIGRPIVDRATGKPAREADGSPQIQFGSKLETACTTPVSEGMVVIGTSERVKAARQDILEFLLTSHPLDCPVCDKGGECPLQNLTIRFGPGQTRYLYNEKMHLAKQVPLGELIYLDRERCIQCARCVRFQSQIADDPVIGFSQRGRSLEIVSISEPGFDSYWSGNTTDICPVGALTTTDFRFSARPWELNSAASICPHCPVGCNLTVNSRREASTGGRMTIKRIMPRQNEWVNEIWICDKGRFAYHYTESKERLSQPLIRKDGGLAPATWEEALDVVSRRFRQAGEGLLTLAGGRLSNEDLFNLHQLATGLNSQIALYTTMAGGDMVAKVGVGQGTNFAEIRHETAILVVACDLEEEAPIWWLRVKQAAERGVTLIVANPRPTKIERYARHTIRYPYGNEAASVLAIVNALSAKRPNLPGAGQSLARSPDLQAAAKALAGAENAVILFGSEGTGLKASQSLAQACVNLLIATNHTGRPNNGLIPVWPHSNDQGAWDMGFRPLPDLKATMKLSKALYVVAADPAGDDLNLAETADFLVVQDLFLTSTAKLADVVLPAQAFTEREGSYTSGERRVQRFYPAVPAIPTTLADFAITGKIGKHLGIDLEDQHASRIMERIAASIPDYAGLSYAKLADVVEQWPLVGRADLYYGGTCYENHQGQGVQLAPAAQRGEQVALGWLEPPAMNAKNEGLLAVPVTRLYDRGQTLMPSRLLHQRILPACLILNHDEATQLGIASGELVQLQLNGSTALAVAKLDEGVPPGIVLIPRSLGIPVAEPLPVKIQSIEKIVA